MSNNHLLYRQDVTDPWNTAGRLLPREMAPRVYWLGDCMLWPGKERLEHSYTATYLVAGTEASLLVDTGHPKDWPVVRQQLDTLFNERGVPPLKWVFPTHCEVTHSGNLTRLLNHYPDAQAIGDMRDQQLMHPDHTDRMVHVQEGHTVDLGGRRFTMVEAVLEDLRNSLWGYDEQEQVLFTADGMGFGHYHGEEHCAKFCEEIEHLPIAELSGQFLEYALYWSRLKSVEPKIARLRRFITEEYPTRLIAGAHGSPISDPALTMPRVEEGMRQLSERFKL
ncbi:MBL fold metallo-hydrolase [Arthrobacter sp. Alg241-R88]|uniref:MBL fold metallo-hydrolase n=1 Tax=Arthrobacter sp. Alg241-R88 TaxID=2305984 RepID=UPI0013D896D9|nr:MBL fold metallo-hydrolase [Arthrobacter sp. Alg241-R88]